MELFGKSAPPIKSILFNFDKIKSELKIDKLKIIGLELANI